MDLNFFKQTRILDGGMGQELLARGMQTHGTLWSANAILNEKYHQLLLDTHRDFVKAGAEVIVTTTFTTRKKRLKENNIEDKFEYLNKKAGEIANQLKQEFPNLHIAGGLPPQELTYEADDKESCDLLYEPSKESVVKTLIPKHLNVQLWQFLLESNASEQAARMVAMENATENAGEMISDLSIEYNKARQAAITTEIIEIVSGANALEG